MMQQVNQIVRGYLGWHVSRCKWLVWNVAIRCPPPVFVPLMRLRRVLFRTLVSVSWNPTISMFVAREGLDHIVFPERARVRRYDAGIDVRLSRLATEYHLHTVPLRDGDVVVDCGANIGEVGMWMARQQAKVRYIAFEPSRREYECLQANLPDALSYNEGLWNRSGTLDFYISSAGADSSLIEPQHYDKMVSVPVVRLDERIDEPIRLLKLEAEGAEPEALQGCERLLHKIDYVSADLGPERGARCENTVAPVVNHLLSHDFELLSVGTPRLVLLFRNKRLACR